jgi:hypothetical protein
MLLRRFWMFVSALSDGSSLIFCIAIRIKSGGRRELAIKELRQRTFLFRKAF